MRTQSQTQLIRSRSRSKLTTTTTSSPKRKKKPLWPIFWRLCSLLIPDCILSCFGMKTDEMRNAWREKFALCCIIFLCCCALAFLTYGMNLFVCKNSNQYVYSQLHRAKFKKQVVIANGFVNYLSDSCKADVKKSKENMTHCFGIKSGACRRRFGGSVCASGPYKLKQTDVYQIAPIHYTWEDIKNKGFLVIDDKVYDPSHNTEEELKSFISKGRGSDASDLSSKLDKEALECFKDIFYCGKVATKTYGCLVADIFLYISTVAIFSLILVRFFLAVFYSWYIRRRINSLNTSQTTPAILLVTCYSEGKEGLKSTLDSLSEQDYPHKIILVIADGMIKGSDNDKTTPEILLDLIEVDESLPIEPKKYIALAKGSKRLNRAKVYPGWYTTPTSKTNIILIIKCGNENETSKAGNRGKRDSQVILMSFFYKLLYEERMNELDFDIYDKMKLCTPYDPKSYELVLMVDADTIVFPDAVRQFVKIFEDDPKVMGMCGETKIMNKCQSWVSMIQVFEYYISHHLTKSFESVFGGVTCLPGCFCIYRIYANTKTETATGITPILANNFILNAYSFFETNTLHEKNLLLLGEDRYLTTLLLKTFYKRKLIFLPKAQCETFVPSEFKVLLSQRRRWINSTIHNLFELVMVDKLCGTFCCSMQFVVGMEMFGTLVLPAAIIFTGVLLGFAIAGQPAWIPLIMLVGILGLPGILILLTTFEISYLFWLIVYIISLPIWNFVLPVYAFWHFDDFSWGQTRMIEGKDEGHGDDGGIFDISSVSMMHLQNYLNKGEKEKVKNHFDTIYESTLEYEATLCREKGPGFYDGDNFLKKLQEEEEKEIKERIKKCEESEKEFYKVLEDEGVFDGNK